MSDLNSNVTPFLASDEPAPEMPDHHGEEADTEPNDVDLEAQMSSLEAEYAAEEHRVRQLSPSSSDLVSGLNDAFERLKRPLVSSNPPARATRSQRDKAATADPLLDPLQDPLPVDDGHSPAGPPPRCFDSTAPPERVTRDTVDEYASANSDSGFGGVEPPVADVAAQPTPFHAPPDELSDAAAAPPRPAGGAATITPPAPTASPDAAAPLESESGGRTFERLEVEEPFVADDPGGDVGTRTAQAGGGWDSAADTAADFDGAEPEAHGVWLPRADRPDAGSASAAPEAARSDAAPHGSDARRFDCVDADVAAVQTLHSGPGTSDSGSGEGRLQRETEGSASERGADAMVPIDNAGTPTLESGLGELMVETDRDGGSAVGRAAVGDESDCAASAAASAASEAPPGGSVFVCAAEANGNVGAGSSTAAHVEEARTPSVGLSAPLRSTDNFGLLCTKKRQFFIFSNSGRPIYTRHGEAHQAAGISSLIYGLLAFAEEATDELPAVLKAGRHQICIRVRPLHPESLRAAPDPRHKGALSGCPIIAVAASRAGEPTRVLQMQLELLHLQLLAWTSVQVEATLLSRPNTDLDGLLVGTRPTFEVLLKRFAASPDYFLGAVEVVKLEERVRMSATRALQQAVLDSGALYGFVATGHRVIAQAHHATRARAPLHVWDLLLLLNFVASNPSFREQYAGQQVFVPMCCPKTAPDAFMHVYVHFPAAASSMFVMLVGAQQADFYSLHTVRGPLMQALDACGALQAIESVLASPSEGRLSLPDLPPLLAAPLAAAAASAGSGAERPGRLAWHLVVVDPSTSQFVASDPSPPIHTRELQKFALQDVMRLHASMWSPTRHKPKEPMRFQWRATPRWALLGLIDKERQIYCILDPLVPKQVAMQLLRHFLRYFASNRDYWLPGGK